MNDLHDHQQILHDTGERMIPTSEGEVSLVFSRHRYTYEYVSRYVEGKNVIDIGCGTGYGSKILSGKAGHVLAIDRDPEALRYCTEHFQGQNLEFRIGDAEHLQADRLFDVAVTFQVIEHLADTGAYIRLLKTLVKKGGIILITTPNVKVRQAGVVTNPFHVNEMTCDQFSGLLQKHFSSFQILGVGYPPANLFRKIFISLPIYGWGKYLRRRNPFKKIAAKTLGMTKYSVFDTNIAANAIDLLAICKNE
jgi:2-polyprenyl-3-methyl-5-hydroxy-6-metoxy-1,4-benzoquinol methylase